MNHSPEPWYVVPTIEQSPGGSQVRTWAIYRKEGEYGHPADATSQANADRIVACVNACQGMPTDILRAAPRGAAKEWFKSWMDEQKKAMAS